MPWPDNGEGRAPAAGPDPRPVQPRPTAGDPLDERTAAAILPDLGDPRRVGELVAEWVGAKLAEVDELVAEGRSRVEAIPDHRAVWLLVGELVMRLHMVEQEVAELKAAKR
jgi:hypothetical protein